MKLELLQQADLVLSKCGRPQLPGGISAVPIWKNFVMPMVLDPGNTYTFTKEISGTVPWMLRAISSDQASNSLTGVRCQIQLPNGRFLFGGNGVDIGQFCWIGSWKWLQDPDLRCEPGSKIQVTLSDPNNSLAAATPVTLLFEGAYTFFLKNGTPFPVQQQASMLDRYYGIVNENILAAAWMQNLAIPDAESAEYYIYSSLAPLDNPKQTTWTLAAGAISAVPNPVPLEIQIDREYDFFVRRVLADIQFTSTAAAIVLSRLRTGAGYVLNDNLIDYPRYLCGAESAGYWKVRGGDSVFVDLQLADFSGTGNVTYQVHLEGFRRRRG